MRDIAQGGRQEVRWECLECDQCRVVALLAVGEKQIPVWRAQGSQGALWTETVRETSELSSVLFRRRRPATVRKSTEARISRVRLRTAAGTGTWDFGGGCLIWKPQVFAHSNMRQLGRDSSSKHPASSIQHGKPLSSWPACCRRRASRQSTDRSYRNEGAL